MNCLFVLGDIWLLHYTCHLFGGMLSCLVANCCGVGFYFNCCVAVCGWLFRWFEWVVVWLY